MASRPEILARRERIQELEAQGITSTRVIAEKLGIPLRTVQADLQVLNAEWVANLAEKRDELKRRQIVRSQRRCEKLLAEWERSGQDKERRRVKESTGAGSEEGEKTEKEVGIEGRLRDSAYMRAVLEEEKHQAALAQLVTQKHEIGGLGGGPVQLTIVEEIIDAGSRTASPPPQDPGNVPPK